MYTDPAIARRSNIVVRNFMYTDLFGVEVSDWKLKIKIQCRDEQCFSILKAMISIREYLSYSHYLCIRTNQFSIFMDFRIEKDTMGEVQVPITAYFGAQTQRSIDNFKIAQDINKMPKEIIRAFAYLKKAAAITNCQLGVLPQDKCDLIGKVCDEILEGKLVDEFPLVVWQTGSGTQSNMNVNEVVAYRAHVLNGGKLTDKEKFIHPNDDVN